MTNSIKLTKLVRSHVLKQLRIRYPKTIQIYYNSHKTTLNIKMKSTSWSSRKNLVKLLKSFILVDNYQPQIKFTKNYWGLKFFILKWDYSQFDGASEVDVKNSLGIHTSNSKDKPLKPSAKASLKKPKIIDGENRFQAELNVLKEQKKLWQAKIKLADIEISNLESRLLSGLSQ